MNRFDKVLLAWGEYCQCYKNPDEFSIISSFSKFQKFYDLFDVMNQDDQSYILDHLELFHQIEMFAKRLLDDKS